MQFGVGFLGANWSEAEHRERVRTDTRAPRPNFEASAEAYAAKVAAETVLADPPRRADLSDAALVERCALCGRPLRPSEASMVRAAFLASYGDESTA